MNWLVKIVRSLVRGLADLSPGCITAPRLQSEALDRKLPLRQRFGLRVHLLLCKWCRRYGKQITFLRNAAASILMRWQSLSRKSFQPKRESGSSKDCTRTKNELS